MSIFSDIKTKAVSIATGKSPEDVSFEQQVKEWWRQSKDYHAELEKRQSVTEAYYLGDQTQKNRVPAYMCNAVDNVIFRDTETLVPMITANLPEFVAIPAKEEELTAQRAEDTQRVLSDV